uniref:Uncharacterized protein n=1 Tax=uncultured marine virus TaxID=186617 RepID=A0A0F7LC03_9VIRU|nr:hypothetical protein [uncultured marine virus]
MMIFFIPFRLNILVIIVNTPLIFWFCVEFTPFVIKGTSITETLVSIQCPWCY